jgi:PASTA domain
MPQPNPALNGQIFYVPNEPEIYWIDNGLARHIPDEATYHGVFGGSPNKQAYGALLTEVTLGLPIADGTELVRAGSDAKIYFVENKTKRWITDEGAKRQFQLNGNVHSLPLATVNSLADGPPFVTQQVMVVPDVTGKSYPEAASILLEASLLPIPGKNPNGTQGPTGPDSLVRSQRPPGGSSAEINSPVDLFTIIAP